MEINKYIPWVEKYRPDNFEDIVLDSNNKKILDNIIKLNYFPNLLLYGPPGTGKTTTIINLINIYQINNNEKNKGLMIHLNASDERGIDIIRYQINNFVSAKGFFNKGIKFIILDEVDYMTKSAQSALKYLIQEYVINVRFCLICNYISKVDESLQNEFVKLRFNYLPKNAIINFLDKINKAENLNFKKEHLTDIQNNYNSDIRSMINFMQTNQYTNNINIISNSIYLNLHKSLKLNKKLYRNYLLELSLEYNIDIKNIIKSYIDFVIRNKYIKIDFNFLNTIEYILHNPESNNEVLINLLYYSLKKFIEL